MEGSLPCSQESSTDPYPEPDRSSPYYLKLKQYVPVLEIVRNISEILSFRTLSIVWY
jgi:hypothetical protein